jgi:hypothetical protein
MTSRAAPAVLLLALLAAGCSAPSRSTFPPIGSTPAPAGDATAATRQAVVGALAAAGLQAADATRPFRPPEGALLAAAPRTVLQVPLAQDPDGGWIVIYALDSPDDAGVAAKDHATYLGSNIGRGLYASGTRFVLQVVGSTVVFFSWLPSASPDPKTATIAQTLVAIGTEVPVPN